MNILTCCCCLFYESVPIDEDQFNFNLDRNNSALNIFKRQNENVQLKFDDQVLQAIATVDENDPDFLVAGTR